MEVEPQKSSPGHHVLGECLFSFGDYGMHDSVVLCRQIEHISFVFFFLKVAKFSTSTTGNWNDSSKMN